MKYFYVILIVLALAAVSLASEAAPSETVSDTKPDVIIKLIKRGAALTLDSGEIEREKRRSSSKKNKGRKVG